MTKRQFPTRAEFERAARTLGCEANAIIAVSKVEASAWGAFLDIAGEPPLILFERHTFSRLTSGRFDGARAVDLVLLDGTPAPKQDKHGRDVDLLSWPRPGGYGSHFIQHQKLAQARKLADAQASYSASWGLFQIMGFNFARAGYSTLREFLEAMNRSVDDHLRAFCSFIFSSEELHDALVALDFDKFKLLYNGTEANDYALKMRAEYEALSRGQSSLA